MRSKSWASDTPTRSHGASDESFRCGFHLEDRFADVFRHFIGILLPQHIPPQTFRVNASARNELVSGVIDPDRTLAGRKVPNRSRKRGRPGRQDILSQKLLGCVRLQCCVRFQKWRVSSFSGFPLENPTEKAIVTGGLRREFG